MQIVWNFRNIEIFYNKYRVLIDKLDIENMNIMAFQVTTCSDDCEDIYDYSTIHESPKFL